MSHQSSLSRVGNLTNMSGGLQRRKVHSSGPKESESSPQQNEEPHKIGFDPQDTAAEKTGRPKLTLMEEVILMGLKDQQGYLSLWNDSLSYVLRGCILIELALSKRIAVVNDAARRRLPIQERIIEVVDDRQLGEPLLDETIKMIKNSEPLGLSTWIDYLSGETWNLYKIGYQLKQVRERLQKGLVDKGILRTEKKNFFLFDLPTHPIADSTAKDELKNRVLNVLVSPAPQIQATSFCSQSVPFRTLRTIALVGSGYAGNVLENALESLGYSARDNAFMRADEILNDYSEFPFERRSAPWASHITQAVDAEKTPEDQAYLEVLAGVFKVFSQLDAVL